MSHVGDMNDYPWKGASMDQLQHVLPTLLEQLSPERGLAMLEMVRSIFASGATGEQLDVWEGSKSFNGITPPPAMAILPAINAPLASTTQQVAFSLELTIAETSANYVRECNMGTFVIIQQPWFAWDKIDTFVEWGINTKYYLTGADMGNGPTLCKQLPVGSSAQYDPAGVAGSWLGPYGVPTLMLPPKISFTDFVNHQSIFNLEAPTVDAGQIMCAPSANFGDQIPSCTAANAYKFGLAYPNGYNWGPYNFGTTWSNSNGYLWNPGYLMPKTANAERANSATYTAILVHAPPTYQFQAGMNLSSSYNAGRILSLMFSCYVTPNPTGTNGNGKVTIGLLTDALQPTYTRDTIQQQAGKNYSHNSLQLNGQVTKKGGGIYILGTNTLQQFKPLQPSLESGMGNGGKLYDAFTVALNPHGCANYHLSTTGLDPWEGVTNATVTYPAGPSGPWPMGGGPSGVVGPGVNTSSMLTSDEKGLVYNLGAGTDPATNAPIGGPMPNMISATVFVTTGGSPNPQGYNVPVAKQSGLPSPYRLTAWNWTAAGGGASGVSTSGIADATQSQPVAASGVNDRIGGAYTQVCFVSAKADCFGTYAQMQEKHSNEALTGHWVSGLYPHAPFSGSSVQLNREIVNYTIPQWPNGLNPVYHLTWSIGCGATRACDLGKGCHLWMRAKGDGRLEQATMPVALGRWAGCAAPSYNGIGAPLPQDMAGLTFNAADSQVTSAGVIAYPDRVATYNGMGGDVVAGGTFDQYRLTLRVPNYAPSTSSSDTRDKWTYIGTFFFLPAMTDAKMSLSCTVEYPRYYDTGVTDVAFVTRIDGLTEKQQFEGSLITNNEVIANSQTAGLNSGRLTAAPKMPLGNEFPELIDLLFRNPNSRFFRCTFKPDEWSKAIRMLYETNDIARFFTEVVLADQGALENLDRVVHCIKANTLPAITATHNPNLTADIADAIRDAAVSDAREAAQQAISELESGGFLGKLVSGINTAMNVANGAAQGLQALHGLLGNLGAAGGLSTGGMIGAAGGLSTGGMIGAGGMIGGNGMIGGDGMIGGEGSIDMESGGILSDIMGLLASGECDMSATGLVYDNDSKKYSMTKAGNPNHVMGGSSVAGSPFKTASFVSKFLPLMRQELGPDYKVDAASIIQYGKSMLELNAKQRFMPPESETALNNAVTEYERIKKEFEDAPLKYMNAEFISRPSEKEYNSGRKYAEENGVLLQRLYSQTNFKRTVRDTKGVLKYSDESKTHRSHVTLPWDYYVILVHRVIPGAPGSQTIDAWAPLSSNYISQIAYILKHGAPRNRNARLSTVDDIVEAALEDGVNYAQRIAFTMASAMIGTTNQQDAYLKYANTPTQWHSVIAPYRVSEKRSRGESRFYAGMENKPTPEEKREMEKIRSKMRTQPSPFVTEHTPKPRRWSESDFNPSASNFSAFQQQADSTAFDEASKPQPGGVKFHPGKKTYTSP